MNEQPGKLWDAAQLKILTDMFHAGKSDDEICSRLGRTKMSIESQRRKQGLIRYVAMQTAKTPWSKENIAILRAEAAKGATYASIGVIVGRSGKAVAAYAKGLGITNGVHQLKKDRNLPEQTLNKKTHFNFRNPDTPVVKPKPVIIRHEKTPDDAIEIMQLTDLTCKWPYGEKGNWRFCGKHVHAGSYCKHHFIRATSSSYKEEEAA